MQENLWNAESKENDNDGKSLAERYSEAKTVTEKKRILSEINDAESDDEELRQAALRLLEEVRHPKVREFAMR